MTTKSKQKVKIQPGPRPQVVTVKKSRKRQVAIGIVLTLTVVVISVIGIYQYSNNKPEKVLADAFENSFTDLLAQKPMESIGQLAFETKSDQPLKVVIKTKTDLAAPSARSNAAVAITFAGKTYNLMAELRVLDDSVLYFKIKNLKSTVDGLANNVSAIGSYKRIIDPLTAKLEGKWVKVTRQDVQTITGTSEEQIKQCASALRALSLSGDDKKQLKELFAEYQPIKVIEVLSSESVQEEESYHYKLDFNKSRTRQFLSGALALESFQKVKNDCGINELNNETKDQVDTALYPTVELWINKKTRRPTQLSINSDNKDVRTTIISQLHFNTSRAGVKAPAESISITELNSEIKSLSPSTISTL